MPRITPLDRSDLADFEPFFEIIEEMAGFVPNSMLTMGRWPELLQAFNGLAGVIQAGASLERELIQLVAFVSSNTSGCRYCQAHTAHGAASRALEKIDAAFEFETSDVFSAAERAALRLARDSSLVPSAVDDSHFADLRAHYTEREIIELVAVISLFGWLNRWNDTLGTTLEQSPLRFGSENLAGHGWDAGKHRGS